MYTPSFKVQKNGVPVVSKAELDAIGEGFVIDFQPSVLEHPAPVDIEKFTEFYLKMNMDYQYLSHNGTYLGMTVFNDTNQVIIYDPNTKRAEYISEKARTIIIDPLLLEDNQHHRFRFTLGHECGHDILHSGYYSYNPDQLSFFDSVPEQPPMVQCRTDYGCSKTADKKSWSSHDWMEWQANYLSSAILMPKTAVAKIMQDYLDDDGEYINRFDAIACVARTFDVSPESADYRLQALGYYRNVDNYTIDMFY